MEESCAQVVPESSDADSFSSFHVGEGNSDKVKLGLLKNKMRLPRMVQNAREDQHVAGAPFLSPSLTSLASSASTGGTGGSSNFPDRRKKKAKWALMIERAREEETNKAAEARKQHKKPLFQRILEKAQQESDREEKEKIETYKQKVAQKMKRIPPPLPLPPPPGGSMAASAVAKPRRGRHSELGSQQSLDTETRGRHAGAGAAAGKAVPLYQRLAARAKADADREAREKEARYNVIRMQKRAAKAPTREELRERERLLEAELERIRDGKPKHKVREGSLERRASTSPPVLPREHRRDRHEAAAGGALRRGRSSPHTVRAARHYRPPSFDDASDVAADATPAGSHAPTNNGSGSGSPSQRTQRRGNNHRNADGLPLDGRPVPHSTDTALHPYPDDDASNTLFSPLSMDSQSRHSSGQRRQKAGGAHRARAAALAAARQPRFAEDADAEVDADDDAESDAGKSLLSKLANARVGSPVMRRKRAEEDGSVASANSAESGGQSRVRFQPDGSSDGGVQAPTEAADLAAMQGDAYLASLLEADEGEDDRASMYAEGFHMMFEEG